MRERGIEKEKGERERDGEMRALRKSKKRERWRDEDVAKEKGERERDVEIRALSLIDRGMDRDIKRCRVREPGNWEGRKRDGERMEKVEGETKA